VSSALESSITLDDVFVVVGARRVPLAAELAGYLALEIAEGATQANGDVDPRTVYIGEEGSVALVMRPRREQASGDAEASIRALLARLLDASGSQTPALASAARRRPSVGMHLLVEELEAALIPVNRAAGRRALARLAREVKRVTLGVGRNASLAPGEPPPRRGSSPSHTAGRDVPRSPQDDARPPPRSAGDELPVAARAIAEPTPPPPPAAEPSVVVAPPSAPDASELPTMEVRKSRFAAAPPVEPTPAPRGADEVDHLLASFGVSARGDHSQRNELKALVGLEPTPPPPGSEVPPDSVRGDSDVESLLAISESAPPVAARPAVLASPPTAISPVLANEPFRASGRAAATQTPPTVPSPSSPLLPQPRGTREPRASEPEERAPLPGTRGVPTAPSARRIAEMTSQPNIAPDRSLTVFALVVVVVCGVAVWLLRPVLFAGSEPHAVPSASVAAPVLIAPAPPRCRASLIVTGAPPSAEILVRAGQAPVDVERMPVGARLEFVATAEGYAPKRAVVPSGATWDSGPDGKPRYEVAVQLDRSRARAGGVDPWPAGEPGSEVGGKGSPGTVHLVTTPRGAEVWQLAALGPDAQFDVKCGGDVELLIAGPTTLRRRLRVAEAEFTTLDGGTDRQATVNAK
jgi:hypothetical protein